MPPFTFSQLDAALDHGEVQMIRPQGDWVTVRRAGRTKQARYRYIPVIMENNVSTCISEASEGRGFPGVRIRLDMV